jgi:tetratricopeptide (TPR) repeat protein
MTPLTYTMSDEKKILPDTILPDESLDDKVEIFFEELELAIKWDRPSILIAVYESEFLRTDVEKMLEERLNKLEQNVSHFHIDEKLFDVPMILVQNSDHEHTVYFITGLKWGGGKGGFNAYRALNMRREFFVDNQMRIVLWLTKSEASNLPRHAPDFWAFRHRVVEFIIEKGPERKKAQDNKLSWDGWKASELRNDIEEKIRLRESMLVELPEGVESQASRTDLLYTLASYYWARGEYEKSLELLNKGTSLAVSIHDSIAESQFCAGKGIVNHSQRKFDSAIAAYQKALEINPYNTYAWNNLAIAYNDQGDSARAIQVCNKSIEIKPRNSTCYTILGDIYRQVGQFEDAKDCYQTACRLEPKSTLNWVNLGEVFSDQHRDKEALRAYLKASRLDPNDASIWKKIGGVYTNMGRLNEAKKAFKKALALHPEDPEIEVALPKLEQ